MNPLPMIPPPKDAPLLPPEETDDGPSLADLFAPKRPAAAAAPTEADEALQAKVAAVIEELRPFINADGGDIRLVAIRDGVVQVRLSGACVGCSSSLVTLQLGVERKIKETCPDVKYVEAV
jgi:Fe-S cluster biogenesis protein NfuA